MGDPKTKESLAEANDWNNYWSLDKTEKFTKISWSKRRIIKILDEYVKKDGNALDAGCGSGFFSKYFCDKGMKTTALDYSDEALKIASAMTEGRAHILKKDLVNDDVSSQINDRFDIIFSDGLLEHFSENEKDRILKNFFELLTPSGVLVTFVPNRWSPWELIRPFFMPGIDEEPFVLSQLIELNTRNQFAVEQSGGINTFPFAFSPDKLCGAQFGMLLYTVATKT